MRGEGRSTHDGPHMIRSTHDTFAAQPDDAKRSGGRGLPESSNGGVRCHMKGERYDVASDGGILNLVGAICSALGDEGEWICGPCSCRNSAACSTATPVSGRAGRCLIVGSPARSTRMGPIGRLGLLLARTHEQTIRGSSRRAASSCPSQLRTSGAFVLCRLQRLRASLRLPAFGSCSPHRSRGSALAPDSFASARAATLVCPPSR